MIEQIYSDELTQSLIRHTLEEEGIAVEIGASLLLESDDLDCKKIVILKPDSYYCSSKIHNPPKSVDGVIITKTTGNSYHFYIIELKSSQLNKIKRPDIQEKFETIFNKFFSVDFKHIFDTPTHNLNSLNLWLVCDPLKLHTKCKTPEEFLESVQKNSKRMKGLMSEYAAAFKPFSFKQKTAMIKPLLSPPRIEENGFVDLLT